MVQMPVDRWDVGPSPLEHANGCPPFLIQNTASHQCGTLTKEHFYCLLFVFLNQFLLGYSTIFAPWLDATFGLSGLQGDRGHVLQAEMFIFWFLHFPSRCSHAETVADTLHALWFPLVTLSDPTRGCLVTVVPVRQPNIWQITPDDGLGCYTFTSCLISAAAASQQ